MAATAKPLCSLNPNIVVAPEFFCWDHVSHKGFALRLSTRGGIEANTDRILCSIDQYSLQFHPAYLAAAQNLCAKRGPNKKIRGPQQCLGSGSTKVWRLPPSCWD